MKIPLAAIEYDERLSPRHPVIDWRYVDELAESIDDLPPVEVVRDGEKRWLADGFHRYQAHRKVERKTIEANEHEGNYDDALALALRSNLRHGKRLTSQERDERIQELLKRGWKQRRIAEALGVHEITVSDAKKLSDAKFSNLPRSQAVLVERSSLPRQTKQALHENAAPTTDAMERRIAALQDERVSEQTKQEIIEGKAPPILFTETGEPVVAAEDYLAAATRAVSEHIGLRFMTAWKHLMDAVELQPGEVVETLDRTDLEMFEADAPKAIEWMQTIRKLVRERLELREAVE